MKKLFVHILGFLRLGIVKALPAGMTADNQSLFGLFAFMQNANIQGEQTASIAGLAAASLPITAAQALCGALVITQGAANQGFTIQLPTTTALFAFMGPTIPTDGTFSKTIAIKNQTNQTGTLTVGDASTTLAGTNAALATNTIRTFIMTVTGPTTITFDNFGTAAL
jgi:hypothetical protein